jgi:hypothetical protein
VVAERKTDEPDPAGRKRLVVVRVPVSRAGVSVVPMGPTPFVPEVPHATVELRGVRVAQEEILEGDGYERYLKPFRTVEDCHVMAALLGWIVQIGRRFGWPKEDLERLLLPLWALGSLVDEPPRSPVTHVVLGATLAALYASLDALEPAWARVDEATRSLWQRDRALLGVAGQARARRRAAAWERLSLSTAKGS